MSYSKWTETDLEQGIAATRKAIEKGQELLLVSPAAMTKGLKLVVESTPKLIAKLERDQAKLEKALAKKREAK